MKYNDYIIVTQIYGHLKNMSNHFNHFSFSQLKQTYQSRMERKHSSTQFLNTRLLQNLPVYTDQHNENVMCPQSLSLHSLVVIQLPAD